MRTFLGSCHCGALSFDYQTALPPTRWSVRACHCGKQKWPPLERLI